MQSLFTLRGWGQVDEDDSAYCQARQRLPSALFPRLLKATSIAAAQRTTVARFWHSFEVKVVDGSCLSLADTPQNQKRYPQSKSQAEGCGFPLMRLVVLFSLASGAILSVVKSNKHKHELKLFRRLWDLLKKGDLLLADSSFGDYVTLATLPLRSIAGVFHCHGGRTNVDFRQGQKLGRHDRLQTWIKPLLKPTTVTQKQWRKIPSEITVRVLKYRVVQKGFRTRWVVLVTTLLDPKEYPAAEIAALYRRRWRLELCFRDLKISMGMEQLRCKTPPMVEKELYMYLIAHNLIRCLMAEAAGTYDVDLDRVSFKGSVDSVRQSSAALAQARSRKVRKLLISQLLENLARDLLPNRPDRVEPRAVKKRPKPYPLLNRPRHSFKTIPHRSRYRKNPAPAK